MKKERLHHAISHIQLTGKPSPSLIQPIIKAPMTETWTAAKAREHFKAKPYKPAKKGKGSKAKDEMKIILQLLNIPFEVEYKFSKERKFRFDYAIPSLRLAVEYEGLGFREDKSGKMDISGHTHPTGYTSNCDKYNLALTDGWRVLRYTALNYKNLTEDLKKLI